MVFNPAYPAAGAWFTPTGGYTPQTSYAGSPYGSQPYTGPTPTTQGSPASGGTSSVQDIETYMARIQQQLAPLLQMLQSTAANQSKAQKDELKYRYEALKRQYEDAEKGRQNAIELQRMRDEVSRYGIDVQRETRLKELEQNQRQFDANHALEMQKFGLEQRRFGLSEGELTGVYNGRPTEAARQFDLQFGQRGREFDLNYGLQRADAIARYSSTPDQLFLRDDLMGALGNAEAGYGPAPYGSGTAPRMKTPADFEAISGPPGSFGRGAPPTAGGGFREGPGSGGDDVQYAGGTPGWTGSAAARREPPSWQDYAALQGFGSLPSVRSARTMTTGGAGAQMATTAPGGPDPRVRAVRAVVDAIPPEDDEGLGPNSYAALGAIEHIFRASKPGAYERMRPGQQAAFSAGLRRLGYVPEDAVAQMRRNNPGQGSSRAA